MTAMQSRSMVFTTGVLIFVAALLITGCSASRLWSPASPRC